MLNINLFIAAGVITSPAICLGIKERKKERKHRFTLTIQSDRFTSYFCGIIGVKMRVGGGEGL